MTAQLTLARSVLPAAILACASQVWAQNPPSFDKAASGGNPVPPPDPQKPEAPVAAPAATPKSTTPELPASAETSKPAEPAPTPVEPSTPTGSAPPSGAESPSAMTLAESPYGSGSPATPSPPPDDTPVPPKPADAPATLFDSHADYAIGGFGGIGVLYTRLAGKNAAQVCGEGAVIIDHALTLGGGGCGIVREIDAEQYGPAPHDPNDRMHFGYGGAIVRYHFFSREMANVSVGGLIGAGGLEIGTWDGEGTDWEADYSHKRSDAVFVFEPQVGGHANLTRWLRVGITAGYRLVSGVNTAGLSAGDLGGPTLGGTIQGGWF